MAAFDCSLVTLITSLVSLCLASAHPASYSLKWQASILLSLKQGFEIPSSPSLASWNQLKYMQFCSWTGVHCDENQSSIIYLDISNFNLTGSFSPIITELRSLHNLSIAGNGFSGIFPPQIHKLSSLQVLNISNNQFNGTLNWEFSHLNELLVLDAYNNNFQGSLPIGVLQLGKLQHLDLGGNYFSGKIPPVYGSLGQLTYLSLAGNDLEGIIPPELGKLIRLKWLRLGYYNKYDGGIPPELGNLENLVRLDLSSCGLQGPIPLELGSLTNLETLFLQTNQLSGVLPPSLGNLTRLKTLDLSNNELTGEIPPQFSGLLALIEMNLFINKFHGEIPHFVAEFPNLEVLKLWRNNFTGSIPPLLGQNGKISELDLSTNKLTGLVPKHLCSGRKLKVLILLNNFLFGPLPGDLGKCDSLVRVRLGQNYLNGSIPSGFLYLPEILLVELQNNFLSGVLMQETNTNGPSKLSQLNLSNNHLMGLIPDSIGNLSSLQSLLLTGNHFSGEIPLEIGQLKNLLKLDLSQNNLSGSVPAEIGNCVQLTYLDLSQNQLSGSIPVQISQIHILNYLNLSFNHLSQKLPLEIGSLKSLTSADFSHNNFSGWIPENGQYSLFNYTSFVDNPFLCGSFLKSCKYASTLASHSSSHHWVKLRLVMLLGLVSFSLILFLFIMRKCKPRKNTNSWKLTAFQKLDFKSQDILACIHDGNIIGKGGAGIVYKGTMPSGENVAVKKLLGYTKDSSHDHGLGAEIKTLGKIRHRNIVRLLAFCSNKETNLLVFEYMPNGSLGEVLHGKRGGQLKWDTRLKIAIEAAKGLCYLHHDCSPLIVHRDVKSNNILLNMDFEAHVADFGLAKFLQNNGTSECMSAIAGSYGYIAPEYAYTLKVDEKSDVYSFGVVLLELLTGRKPVGDFGEDGLNIVQWTRMQTNWIKEKVINIQDERLQDVQVNQAMQVFFVAMLCVQEHSVERPTMREVVQMLTQAKQPNTFHME